MGSIWGIIPSKHGHIVQREGRIETESGHHAFVAAGIICPTVAIHKGPHQAPGSRIGRFGGCVEAVLISGHGAAGPVI